MADDPMAFFGSLSEAPKAPDTPAQSGPSDFFSQFAEQSSGKDQYGQLSTALHHGAHGLTSGFSDEMLGARAASPKIVPEFLGPIPAKLAAGAARIGIEKAGNALGFDMGHEASDAYTKARDEERKALEESNVQHPATALLSDVAGSMAVPGGGALKGATWGSRLLRGAAVSGAQGALRGAGEAPELEDVPGSSARGAAVSALVGAPLNAALGPRVANTALQEIKDVADKYGVQLPHYMVSESPFVQSMGRGLDQLKFVGSALGRAGEKAREGVQDIRDKFVSGPTGTTIPTEARTIASNTADKAVEDFDAARRKVSEHNYNAVTGAMSNPNFRQQPSNMINEVADQIAKLQTYNGNVGPILQQAIDAVQVRGGLTYDALKNLRTRLYDNWKSMQGKSDTNRGDYIGLIGAITKDMEDVVNQAGGPRAVKLWQSANAQHAIGKDISKELGEAIGKGTGDTSAADSIFRNISSTKPNVGAVTQLRNTMKPQEWEQMQAATMARMGADDAGNFSIDKFLTADKKLSEAGKNAMFGVSGPKREAYDAIQKLGKAINAVDQFKNTSKTAPVLATLGLAGQLYSDFKNKDYTNTAGEIGAGAIVAAILARPATARNASRFGQMLDRYVSNPTAYAAGKLPRALEVAARNFMISLDNSKYDRDKFLNHFVGPTPLGMQ